MATSERFSSLFARVAVAGKDRDPDARRDVDLALRERKWTIELRADPVRDRGNARLRLDPSRRR